MTETKELDDMIEGFCQAKFVTTYKKDMTYCSGKSEKNVHDMI